MRADSPRITGPTLKVLKELMQRPSGGLSGAEIARATGLASGTLYPLLFRLEKSAWLKSKWEDVSPSEVKRPRRRLYQVTALGEAKTREAFKEFLPDLTEPLWQL
jgi:DNA-binding PadR family transcriptional regulator